MLIKKAESKMNPFEVWGDGSQIRDFIYVEDVVDGLLTVLEKAPTARPYNIAYGKGTSVVELVKTITSIYGYDPELKFDLSKPTMIPVRLVDTSRVKDELGWESKFTLQEGLTKTIDWYNNNKHLYV
jgi:GDP-L-fucose synthase